MKYKCVAYIVFKDGSAQISEHKLKHNLPFALSEMRKWIKERSKKPIKSIKFLRSK